MSSADVWEVQEKLRRLDVVFVIDTTGSMASSIAEVKKRLKGFAHELAQAEVSPDTAFGIVAYRDHPPEDTTYVTQVYPLVRKVETAQVNINKLTATGGGDGPEAVLDGLNDALNAIRWREYAHKVVLLVGDAPPHGMGGSGDKWPKGCPCGLATDKIVGHAQAMGIIVHAVGVRADPAMTKSFKRIASSAGGAFVPLAKVDALIDRILELLRAELGKVAVDIDVFGAWASSSDKSAGGLAGALGKSADEVDESLRRLEAKGVLAADEATADDFRAMLGEAPASDVGVMPTLDVDAGLLDQIKIGEPADGAGTGIEADFEIRVLDE